MDPRYACHISFLIFLLVYLIFHLEIYIEIAMLSGDWIDFVNFSDSKPSSY